MSDSWSQLNDGRRATRARWPRIWSLPRIDRSTRWAAAHIPAGASVLDIGASDGRFGRKLAAGVVYKTLDVDPRMAVDYRALADVADRSFDFAVSFEMIEHVTLPEALAMLQGVARVLKPGGRLFLSTPNVHHPWSYLRSCTHKTPFCYDELGGLMTVAGLEVEALFRCHHDAFLKAVARVFGYPLYRILDSDYAKSILAVARAPMS